MKEAQPLNLERIEEVDYFLEKHRDSKKTAPAD